MNRSFLPFLLVVVSLSSFSIAAERMPPLPAGQFVNPIGEGADPWVVRDPNADRYLWCLSEGNRAIAIHTSARLTSFGEKRIVWRAPESGPFSREVWAPELHFMDGHWHIYFAASDGDNQNHLAYVLRSEGEDPLGSYTLHGPLATGDGANGRSPNIWAIDMTPLEYNERLYAIWSGWDAPGTDRQFLYIAPMKSPTEMAGPRVRICPNDDHPWEFTEDNGRGRGLNEGPQVLKQGGRTFVTYSCAGSWLPTYKLGLLELTGRDPLDPKSWTKSAEPAFQSTEETYGVGHSCFVPSPDGSELWHVFHAKLDRNPGWRRGVFLQPMRFHPDTGLPDLGQPVAPAAPLAKPSGEAPAPAVKLPWFNSLKAPDSARQFSYFGHHQFYRFAEDGLHLGVKPANPINAFPSGEKAMLDGALPADVECSVAIDFTDPTAQGEAGIVFRATGAGLGWDAFRGYFVGVSPGRRAVVLGKMDGKRFKLVKLQPVELDPGKTQKLQIATAGDSVAVTLNGRRVFELEEYTHAIGSAGLRVVRTHAVFTDFKIASKTIETFSDRFEDGVSGDWDFIGGDWSEAKGVLSVSDARGGPRALVKGLTPADFEMIFEAKAGPNSQAGAVFRLAPESGGGREFQGYFLGMKSGGDEHVMWGAGEPRWRHIANKPTRVPEGEWMSFRIQVHGNHVRAWINQSPVAEGRFPKFDGIDNGHAIGRIGFRALGKSAAFRNLSITPFEEPPLERAFVNPVQSGCADPVVLLHKGVYYAYSTHSPDWPNMPRGIRLHTSTDLANWSDQGYVMTAERSWGNEKFWAPDIVEKDGAFYLYYAVETRICVAKANSPLGPFTQVGDGPIEPGSIRIDAHVLQDDDGGNYLYYVKFNRGNEIWGGRLNDDMVSVDASTLRLMVKPDQPWERHQAPIVEGPEVIKHKGLYYLTYSGSHFQSPEYAVGYATSDSPLGPWKKHEHNPIMKSTAYAHGTAHHCLTTSPDGKERFIVYHRHSNLTETEPRQLSVDRIQFVPQENGPDLLEVWGPTRSPQPLPSAAR